jgi:26S proteasome regulatory subunit N1
LIAHGERAELATDQYLAETPILENFVILRQNPDWDEEVEDPKKKKNMMKA